MCYLDFESFTTRNFAVVSDSLCTQCGISAGLSIIESAETISLSFPISIVGSHAKFCVMDGESAYIGSANLTSPGLSSQLELGVLVHGEIALQIEQFWDYAVDLGLFIRITSPSATCIKL